MAPNVLCDVLSNCFLGNLFASIVVGYGDTDAQKTKNLDTIR